LLLVALAFNANAADVSAPDYVKDVAPILTKYCAGCHGADEPEGKLSLESFVDLQKGGEHGASVVPGQAASSRMIRVLTGEVQPKMPPKDNEAPSEAEIAILKFWIDAGAKGPEGVEPPRMLVTPKVPAAKVAGAITAIAMSPQGTLLAVAQFGKVELRAIGGPVLTLANLPGKVNAVHFSADGSQLVTASGVTGLYGVASIWNVTDGKLVREFKAHRDIMYDAELSPDGKILATCSYDRNVILWDANSGEQLRTLEGHNDAIYDLAFSPDGNVLATASGDETAKLWLVATGERLDTLHQPEAEQYVVAFSPDGKLVLAGGADNRIRVWEFVSKTERVINPLVYARFAHEGAVVGLAFSSDGKTLISAADDRTMKSWETGGYTETHLYERQPDEATGLAISPFEKSLLVGRADGSVGRYEIVGGSTNALAAGEQVVTTVPMTAGEMSGANDAEPNDAPAEATPITVPTKIAGVIHANRDGQEIDADLYRFTAKAGEEWMIEVNAERQKSPLDSRVEVLDSEGHSIQRVLLQAVRDSYFTFRGKDSNTSDDYRVHNWQEMELNQFLYADGEVVKLWHYPRGPDSGYQVYPGSGNRFCYFDTTPMSHALQAPCYIVEPHAPGTELIPNGLPVFPLYYENDDESRRKFGSDSLLSFTAPRDGEYIVRITDARSFSGADYKYDLSVRPRMPSFKVTLGGANPTVNAGSGKEFTVSVDRIDGFEGEIRIDIEGLPPGFQVTTPIVIEEGQTQALGTINALPDAPALTPENAKATKVTATAMIRGQQVSNEVNNLGEIKLAEKPKLLLTLLSANEATAEPTLDAPLELTIAPGETISARVRVERNGFDGGVAIGKADAGRNMPHGVYVDNIGLNGLLIVEGQNERTFYITASKTAIETTRMFHLRSDAEGNQTSWPVILHVRRRDSLAQNENK
jgi:WD40 repeat protein